ncbi:MAG TPA: tryptophan--tRNA ligase [Sulfurihydrogenibium sp.]|uniref:tryptophan--tRNA ligase n=1 Tax=Sulfurihydrogenibium sp. (strain YO3AOP1) TaxID=436114 RepID=UPI00017241C3|nr:tryptophan--tRNA ligase [Sulfurihydrogenibium sp. YO3AOP1]ACD65988.1 tryptophanyl-tRNA synthetase [Sulfurihydrogenibium sp. YO3AOP1]HBT99234.1 tryptophan--tRNA ligase [Sulfurihydrogenibium sp.]
MRIVSGMRPTGKLHLGHYFGVIKNWLKLQDSNECFFFVADWHALTNKYKETSDLKQNIYDLVIDWLSCGINPEKSTIFVQSGVKEHSELALLFGMITPKSWLELNPSYKDLKFNLIFQYIRDFLFGKNIKIDQDKLHEIVYKAFYHKKDIDYEGLTKDLTDLKIKQEIVNEIVHNIKEGDIGKDIDTFGFFGYPILMAADILIYNADAVPVGEDQLPHIEITREIARRFNNLYSPIFKEPQALLTESSKLLGTDGRKMSKSYNNTIVLSEPRETLEKKVLSMKTDPQRLKKTDPGRPEICNVFSYHKYFTDSEDVEKIQVKCKNAEIGCVECKRILFENIDKFLSPIREKRKEYEENIGYIEKIIITGTEKAKEVAIENMKNVRNTMGLINF